MPITDLPPSGLATTTEALPIVTDHPEDLVRNQHLADADGAFRRVCRGGRHALIKTIGIPRSASSDTFADNGYHDRIQ